MLVYVVISGTTSDVETSLVLQTRTLLTVLETEASLWCLNGPSEVMDPAVSNFWRIMTESQQNQQL